MRIGVQKKEKEQTGMRIGKLLKLAIPMLMLVAVFSLMPKMNASAEGGSGTATDPFTIASAADLVKVREIINAGSSTDTYGEGTVSTGGSGQYFKLTADIDLSSVCGADIGGTEVSWIPIGSNAKPFKGYFDGDDHSIKGVYINSTSDYQGLFGYADGAQIEDVCLEGGSITGEDYVGGICGFGLNTTIITNCVNTGAVSGTGLYVGGICGCNEEGTITNCVNTGAVSGTGQYVGGICGNTVKGTITNCTNTGAVSGGANYGGICGLNYRGTITNCINTGAVSGGFSVGGICGDNNEGTITNCYYDKQMCTVGGINGSDESGSAEGKLTAEMTGSLLSLGTDWEYAANMYPRLKSMKDTDAAILAATPIFLRVDTSMSPVSITTCDNVTSGFKIGTGNGVTWSSSDSTTFCVYQDRVLVLKNNTQPVTLTATLGDVSKSITLKTGSSLDMRGGSEEHPLLINNVNDLEAFRDAVNDTNNYQGVIINIEPAKKYFLLTNNIDLSSVCGANIGVSGTSWTPIGSETKSFKGNFDGGGHSISGLYINASGNYQGLFGCIENAKIENFYLKGGSINGDYYVGGICGHNDNGTITNCINTGAVSGDSNTGSVYVGGICGYNVDGIITSCINTGAVSGNSNTGSVYVGGICGQTSLGRIINCINTGSVSRDSNTESVYVGGICGHNDNGTIQYCYYNSDNCSIGGINGLDVTSSAIGLATLNMTGSSAFTSIVGFDDSDWQAYSEANTVSGSSATLYYPQLKVFCSNPVDDADFISAQLSITTSADAANFDTTIINSARPDAQEITITNNGNTRIPSFTVGSSNTDFDVVYTSSAIAPSGTATFTVQPKDGLGIGVYDATITIQASQGVTKSVTVHYEVITKADAQAPTGPSSTPASNPLQWYYAENKEGTLCKMQEQGPACKKVMEDNMPEGFEQAFTFNLSFREDGYIPNYSLKKGTFRLTYLEGYQKTGRTFALMGINNKGEAMIFYDEDKSDETITVNLDLEGYSFALIYSDTEKGNPTNATVGTTAITGDYYIVMPGDTLSSIAIRSGKTVNYLANINSIENINFLRIGQKIKLK